MLGGRTNHWGRISLRFGPWDFKGRSRDGLGDDWPIGYEDLKPYYDRLDEMVGIFGTNEGLENEPDGIFLPPPKPRCYEPAIQKEREAGAAFFTLFRDLVASGFWTSRIGVEDLQYKGNTYVAEWTGCPPEVLSRLGLEER